MATSKTEVEAASENARVKMALSLICRYDNTALLAIAAFAETRDRKCFSMQFILVRDYIGRRFI